MSVKKKKIIKLILMLILIMIIGLFWGGRTFAKYTKHVKSSAVSEIAKPIFVIDGAKNIKIDGIQDTVYEFCVKNYNDEEINEVEMNYYIEIVNDSKADLEFVLIKNGQLINLENNKSNFILLKRDQRQKDDYQLQIKYTNNSNTVSDIKGNIQIKVEAIQVE